MGQIFNPLSTSSLVCLLFGWLTLQASANYFIINEPAAQREWVNNAANLVTWTKELDDTRGFDVEMARMSTDGLTLVAKNVRPKPAQFNIFLQDVPAGDDYFLIFLNSSDGFTHTTSRRFTILASNVSPSSTPPSPASNAATITVSGSPNPTKLFATTFPALRSSAWRTSGIGGPQIFAMLMTVLGCVFGIIWTVA